MPRTKGAFIVRYELHNPDLVLQSVLPTLPPAEPKPSYAEQFEAYLEAHPETLNRVMGLAMGDVQAGRTIHVKRYIERLRAEIGGFDNNLCSPMAHRLNQHPDLQGRVALRARKAE